MTLATRLAKIEAALPAPVAEPADYFGLTPDEFRRQCAIACDAAVAAFGSGIKPECPPGISPELFDCAWNLEMSV